jgi:hypothetical protein
VSVWGKFINLESGTKEAFYDRALYNIIFDRAKRGEWQQEKARTMKAQKGTIQKTNFQIFESVYLGAKLGASNKCTQWSPYQGPQRAAHKREERIP